MNIPETSLFVVEEGVDLKEVKLLPKLKLLLVELTLRRSARKRPFFKINGNGCWEWVRAKIYGYGTIDCDKKTYRAHRFFFEKLVRSIPLGLVLDHLCRNHACCNPEHLEIVTVRENTMRGNTLPAMCARKTHCKNGHDFNSKNTSFLIGKSGFTIRICKICRNKSQKRYMERKQNA